MEEAELFDPADPRVKAVRIFETWRFSQRRNLTSQKTWIHLSWNLFVVLLRLSKQIPG